MWRKLLAVKCYSREVEGAWHSIRNFRGQAYDNGANMKGKKQGVQARQLNTRALFVPCGAHTMNLVIAGAAKSSQDATGYFGYLQK